ncbi:hypothetical protein Pst134EB_020085 [Puccinia striiformis f. sp. tritici]|nr:hypothetical protein Pst134EB_020085 [Puccinia striiformis f. sp. tritici]
MPEVSLKNTVLVCRLGRRCFTLTCTTGFVNSIITHGSTTGGACPTERGWNDCGRIYRRWLVPCVTLHATTDWRPSPIA